MEWSKLLRAPLELATAERNNCLSQQLIDARVEFGTAVYEAVRNGLGGDDRLLQENGAAIDTKDSAGGTALHVATRNGKPEIARALLAKGAGKNALGSKGRTPIYWAAREGHIAVTRVLLDAGADLLPFAVSAWSRRWTQPLLIYWAYGHHENLYLRRGIA